MTNPQISAETIDELRQIDSATVSNAIEHFGVRDQVTGYASTEMRSQFPDHKPMVGFAVTATHDTTSAGDDRPNRLHDVLDMVAAAPKPVVLAVQYTGGDRLRSCLAGDMFCSALQKLGGVGIVTDLGSRDFHGIQQRAPGFQLFCPGAVVSHGHGVFTNLDITVSIYGLTIQPGDLLHGDVNGVVSIPLAIAEDVVDQAQRVLEAERSYFDFLASDQFSYEGLRQRMGGGQE
jgi:regulator of RNase E activity RraA